MAWAIPGERTTAALLLKLLGKFDTVPMRFDAIEDAVLRGQVDCGVLIHEGRFTYAAKGLVQLADLGAAWEERMKCPVALGAIAIRRALGPEVARDVDARIRESVAYARAHPEASAAFVREHERKVEETKGVVGGEFERLLEHGERLLALVGGGEADALPYKFIGLECAVLFRHSTFSHSWR